MRKGSITVFLSLVLVLLFSFLLTTLEAARIQGAEAYLSMISNMAGDSFLAGYYYPLFRDYRLFAVNAGDEDGEFSIDALEEEMQTNVAYGMEGIQGGLLQFRNTTVEIEEYTSLLSAGKAEFLSQVRQQAVLDGLTLPMQELFSGEQIKEVAVTGKLYREQESALEATATVTTELLKLMELTDGVSVTNSGIRFDKEGNVKREEVFIKQILPLEKEEIASLYENKMVYRAVSDSFFRAEDIAKRIKGLLNDAKEYAKKISACESRMAQYDRRIEILEEKLETFSLQEEADENELRQTEEELEEKIKEWKDEKKKKKSYEDRRGDILTKAKTEYNGLKKKLQKIQEKTEEALRVTNQIEKKQAVAQVAVETYETFLTGTKEDISEELFQTFSGELEMMKYYAGMEESGIYTEQIRESLSANRNLLSVLALSGFSTGNLDEAEKEMDAIMDRIREYTMDGLWFPYGELVANPKSGEDVTGALKELLSEGILSLVGVGDSLSKKSLDGGSLPSEELEKEKKSDELMDCVGEVLELFQNGNMEQILEDVQKALSDKTALELYARKYFHAYGEETEDTRLEYEREYLLFGEKADKDNLRDMVLYLLALRTLFCMVMILKQPDRMAELDSFAAGVAGFTGIPVLASVVKYSLLMLWSVEEALVEVSVLMKGRKIPFVGNGCVEFHELFALSKESIAQKAQRMPERGGNSYSGYLTFLSLLKGTEIKAYRAMDLIQENIRLRYSDSFRIANQITGLSYYTNAFLKPMFDTGFFEPEVYEEEYRKEVCFGACS